MNISFRLLTESELDVASAIFVAAYDRVGDRRETMQQYLALQPDGWWLALADDVPAGYGGAVDYGAFSYVGMLSVYPAMQNRGIGETLTKHILAWGKERGCPTMLLDAAERAASLYAHLGFIGEGETYLFHREASAPRLQLPYGVDLLQLSDMPELVAFDALYFGAERARIFTSPIAFAPGRAFVTRNHAGRMTGYIFVQQRFLGPWVASNVKDAENLLRQALTFSFERGTRASIPAENEVGCELLQRYGFSLLDTDQYMCYGDSVPRQRSMIYGQTSAALG